MVKLVNRAKMTIASGGAGNITLGTAVDGYQTFADAGVSDTDVVRYTIEDGDDWEIGTGVYTASGTILVRTVTESSNSNAALTCSADAVIFVTMAAEDFTGNAAPRWTTTPTSSLEFTPGVAATITGVAIDEAGYPIQYSWDGFSGTNIYSPSNLPDQLSTAPTFNTSTKSWTLTPSSSSSDAGSFVFRSRASDGVNTLTASTSTILSFMYTSGLLGWYDADNYTSGSTSWPDKSGNSGPSLTVDPSKITYNASGVGSLPIISINNSLAVGTNTSFGTGATVVVIGHGRARTITQYTQYYEAMHAQSFTGGVNNRQAIFIGYGYTFAAANYFGSNTKVFVDKTDVTSYNVGQYSVLYDTPIHSFVVTDLDQSNGYSLGGSSSVFPQWDIRAILIYDHEPSTANVAMIHDYFKGFYASDSDMAP